MKRLTLVLAVFVFLLVVASPALAAPPARAHLFYEGDVVRTLVPPAAMPHEGVDDLYVVGGDLEGQIPVAAVAPGDQDYHGGKWAVSTVSWNVAPYLLDSATAVLEAESNGDVTIARVPGADFKCPIQP